MASADAVVVGLLGVAILVAGAGIASGRLWLLANLDREAIESERRVARVAGGSIVAFGVLTVGLARGLSTGRAGDWWWTGWALAAMGVAAGVAAMASGRA